MSRYMWLKLLTSKDEASTAIIRFQVETELESGHKLRTLRTDRGGEFMSTLLDQHCLDHGIKRHLTAPYSPQQNGVVERRNQTVVGMARSMLKAKEMPIDFWGEVVTTAIHILNRSPTKSLEGVTPYEAWYGRKPSVHYMRTFGCIIHVKVVKPNRRKFEDQSKKMVFIGYEQGSKAYRAYNPVTKQVHVTRDAIFSENNRWNW